MQSKAVKTLAMILLFLGIGSMVTACDNTIRGIGQDVEDTGDAIEDSAS